MINIRLLFSALLVSVFCIIAGRATEPNPRIVYDASKIVGEDFTAPDNSFATHCIPEEYPYRDTPSIFNVTVNGKYLGIYSDRNWWGGIVSFAMFEFKPGTKIEVKVAMHETVAMNSFEILPHNADVSTPVRCDHDSTMLKYEPNCISFTINKPDQKITLVFNENYRHHVLHLFANSVDDSQFAFDARSGYLFDKTTSTHYFAPGYHNLKALTGTSVLTLKNGENVYVAAGAVVDGSITANGIRNSKIGGRGLFVNNNWLLTYLENCHDVTIEGLTMFAYRYKCWSTLFGNCTGLKMTNTNIIATRYASVDGIDINTCQDCEWDNCFVRSCDDAIAIKGLYQDAPHACPANRNLKFTRMQLWNDCNNAFGMGAETHASAYENISLTDSEILFSYDDPNFHEQLEERSALNICALHGTYFRNILFENIVVNRCERLIGLSFFPDFWFGSLKGNQSTPGAITDVTFRNIKSLGNSGSSIANEIRLTGWKEEPMKPVKNITFENLIIQGKHLKSMKDKHIVTNNNGKQKIVSDIYFK